MFDSSQTRLILVQSDPVLAELTSFRLELLGYGIQVCLSGAEAAAATNLRLPDLVIVDTKLSDGDGIEWIIRIRGEHPPAKLPILVFSADTQLESVERAFAAGAQDYLLTPYDPTVLEAKIERALGSGLAIARR